MPIRPAPLLTIDLTAPRRPGFTWPSAANKAVHAAELWLESEWTRGASAGEDTRRKLLDDVRAHVARLRVNSRQAFVLPGLESAALASHVSALLAWRQTRILAPALLAGLPDAAVLGPSDQWQVARIQVPSGFKGPYPARWIACTAADNDAVAHTLETLTRDGMTSEEAIAAARLLQ